MHKISVIMGVYNCKNVDQLKKSVLSIINQTYQDWELLICNDGSSDTTLDTLRKIAKLDKRIRILSYDQNAGLANALNVCLKNAKGSFIARQDDDDESDPLRFEKQLDFLLNHKEYSFVGCSAKIFDRNGIWGDYETEEKPKKESFFWNNPFIHPTDYDLFMRLYACGAVGYNIQEKLYVYRIERDLKKKYRPMKYRVDEAQIRYYGFKALGMLPKGILYIIKPIIIGLIPQFIFNKIRKSQY